MLHTWRGSNWLQITQERHQTTFWKQIVVLGIAVAYHSTNPNTKLEKLPRPYYFIPSPLSCSYVFIRARGIQENYKNEKKSKHSTHGDHF